MANHNKSFTPIKSKTMPAGQYGSIEPTVTELPVGGDNPFRDLPTVTRATRKPMLDAPIFRRKGALALTALAVVVGVAAISGIATGASPSRNNAHAHTPRLRGEGAMVSAPDSEDADALLDTDLHKKSHHHHHHDDKKSHHHHDDHDHDKDHHDKGWHKSKARGHGEQPEQPEQTEAVTAPKPGSTQDAHWGTDVFDWRKYAGGAGFGGAAAAPAPVADTARAHTHTHTTHAHDDHKHETTTTTTTSSAVPVEADKPGSRKNEHWGTDVFDWRVYTGGRAPGQDAAAAQEKAEEKKVSTHGHDHHHDHDHDDRRSKHGHKVHLDSLSDAGPADLIAEAPELVDEEGEGPLVEEADLARRGHSTRAHGHDDDKEVEETTTTTTTTSTTPETEPPGEEKNNHWGTDKYDWRTHTGGQAPGQAAAEKGKEAQAKQEKEEKTKSKAKDSHKD